MLTGAAAESRVEACSVLTSREKFLLAMVIVALVLLSITLFFVYRRNRRLEYKYTRLVESRTGELPAAETCGLEEDEDEDVGVCPRPIQRHLSVSGPGDVLQRQPDKVLLARCP